MNTQPSAPKTELRSVNSRSVNYRLVSFRLVLPIVVLLGLSVFLLRGLWLDPKKLPSVFIGKPLPVAELQVLRVQRGADGVVQLVPDPQPISTASLQGQPWVMNVFASWCQACLVEHPNWLAMKTKAQSNKQASPQDPAWRLVGLAYKDDLQATLRWLEEHGNPYDLILLDPKGQYGIDLGVYGVPETFVMSANNQVVHKQVGPIGASFATELAQYGVAATAKGEKP